MTKIIDLKNIFAYYDVADYNCRTTRIKHGDTLFQLNYCPRKKLKLENRSTININELFAHNTPVISYCIGNTC